jgi:cyclase
MPVTVGGGVRTVEDVRALLAAGADKVAINTSAVERPVLINEAAERFGCQCVVVAIDAKRAHAGWEVYTHGGRTGTGREVFDWVREVERRGAGEILLTSMDRDGTKSGYDVELTKAVATLVRIPVVASGGAGMMEHFRQVLTDGGADAALAASLFHFGELPIQTLKEYLAARGVPIRR